MNTDNLIKNVKDFFLSQYNKSLINSKTYVSFEPLAHMVVPEDYKAFGQYDAVIANQQLSRLCDKVPVIGELFDSDGLSTLGEKYTDLKDSLLYTKKNVTGDDRPYAEKFMLLKAKAELLLKGQPVPSIIPGDDGNAKVYLCTSTPSGWYDPNSSVWAHKIIRQSDTSAASTHAGSTLAWKLNAITEKIANNQSFKIAMSNRSFLEKIDLVKVNEKPSTKSAQKDAARTNMEMNPVSARAGATVLMASTGILERGNVNASVKPVELQELRTSGNAVNMLTANTEFLKVNTLPVINKEFYTDIQTSMPFSQMVKVNRVIGKPGNTETKEVRSTDFVMDFHYAVVTIERSWMYPALFEESNAKLWYALAKKAGSYSTGENAPSNTGSLRAVPKAMIVLKDMTITAKWTEEDKRSQSSSYGLGSFNTSHGHFSADNNSLVIPGIQILGWVCEVLPKIPLNNDDNFL